MSEVWKAILEFPEYAVSTYGRVMRAVPRLPIAGKRGMRGWPASMLKFKWAGVNHKNGMKSQNYVDNLEWATYSEQTQHGLAHDLIVQNPITGRFA